MIRITRLFVAALTMAALALPVHAAERDGKIDINRASVEELTKLPRIGPSLAQKIVEYRKSNGGFRHLEDLMSVKGIGKKSFESLKDKVTIGDATNREGAAKDPVAKDAAAKDAAGKDAAAR